MKAHNSRYLLLLAITFIWITGCGSPGEDARENPSAEEGNLVSNSMPFSENATVFEIQPVESEARFYIDEILRGEEKTVIGKTGQVSGQIAVDFADPTSSAVGPVQVNAFTLETDNAFRNRALQTRILLAAIYEFITFSAQEIKGLPEIITIGEPVEFQIEGDLTITSYTQPVIFDVSVLPISQTRLEGKATAVIDRTAFDLVIPQVADVAGVDKTVILELDFVAAAIQD